jgi:hypothetical protein
MIRVWRGGSARGGAHFAIARPLYRRATRVTSPLADE